MQRTFFCFLTLAAALLCAPAAHAAGWVTSGPLSPPNRIAAEPQVVLLPDGSRVVAWVQVSGNGQALENVSVRTAPPNGDFGPVQVLPAQAGGMRLAAGADGTVAVAWTDSVTRSVHVARRAPGQDAFADATPIIPPGDEFPFGVDIAVSQGDVYLSYNSIKQGATTSVWAARLPAGGNAIALLPGGALDHTTQVREGVGGAAIAVENGRVAVAWERGLSRTPPNQSVTSVMVARRNPGGAFGAPVALESLFSNSEFPPGASPAVAAGGGHTYVVWERGFAQRLAVEDLANPGPILSFDGDRPSGGDFKVAVDATGSLVAAWEGRPVGFREDTVSAGRIPADGAPLQAQRLTPIGVSRILEDVAVAEDGATVVVAGHGIGGFNTTIQLDASLAPGASVFGAPEDVAGLQDVGRNARHVASAAVAPGGRALTAWSAADHSGTLNERLFLSERDATPPEFGAIAVPETATVGQRIDLAASATDALAGAAVSWQFGDGSEADGERTSHVFGRAGAATVTVTATDSVGNTTTQTRVVAVAPAPRAGAGPGAGPGPSADPQLAIPPDRTKPVVSALTVSNRRFRVGSRATAAVAGRGGKRAPAGTTLRMTLYERSTLAIAISTKSKRRTVVRGTLVRARSGPGRVAIAFSGRLGRSALRAGSYTATVTAIDGAGNRSSAAKVKFAVVKR